MSCPMKSVTVHVEQLGRELCLYDWQRKEVHNLNPTAALVWQQCDGQTSPAEMAEQLRIELHAPHAEELVSLTLAELEKAHLLQEGVGREAIGHYVSRRDLMRALGATAALLPVISSIVAPTPVQAQSIGGSQTFDYTGASQSFVVPAGVASLTVNAYGAQGGSGNCPTPGAVTGGKGGLVQATITVTPGETLTVYVGGEGPDAVCSTHPTAGAFNGGGSSDADGGGGGGASDVRRAGTKLVIAGGGGGGGSNSALATLGGAGGGTTGASGGTPVGGGGGGGGGTPSAGGSGGAAVGFGGTSSSSGSSGTGGTGGRDSDYLNGGGGGGGGYFGGGGGGFGGTSGGGGGGGSSYSDPAATSVTHTQGTRSGDGQVIINWV